MLKFYVQNIVTKEVLGILTDEQIDNMHLDTRVFEITPINEYNKRTHVVPSSIVEAYIVMAEDDTIREGDVVYTCDEKRYKRIFFPIFKPSDLDKFYVTASGHYVVTESLDEVQKVWVETTSEVKQIFG